MRPLSFVDLFAGCGGISLGFSQAGLAGRFAIERDPMAFETLNANLLQRASSTPFAWPNWLERRAWDIDEVIQQHEAELSGLRGQVDVLAGGPPCQGFSFAGRRLETDPRNLLFERYVQVVDLIKPQLLVLENVPGMRVAHVPSNVVPLRSKQAHKETAQSYYDRLVECLHAIGYRVEARLIDASAFGVPQRRSRLIAIGMRKELLDFFDEGVPRAFELLDAYREKQLTELGLESIVSAADAISDLEMSGRELVECVDPELAKGRFREVAYEGPETPYQRLMNREHGGRMDSMRLARHRDDVRDRFQSIITECRRGVRMDDASRKKYGLKKHRIHPMSPLDPSPTITTLPDDILHYSEPRILTVRESARLQSFPDWFAFKGKFTTGGDRRTRECPRYTQVGNAVPPLLARAIGQALTRLLEEVEVTKSIFGPLPSAATA
jgi:DNA (cytosine-5)-methyltransferase 1